MQWRALLTPAKEKEEPPLLGECGEDNNQHEIEHDPLTHHPAEGGQQKVLDESRHNIAWNLYGHIMYVGM